MGSNTPAPFCLPLVDITPFLRDPDGLAAQDVICAVREACKSTGFFQMKGHGVSTSLQERIFEAGKRFFALPLKKKLQLDARKTVGFRGYDVMESQSYELEFEPVQTNTPVSRDVKEGFFASTDLPLEHPLVASGRFLQGPNVWPEAELLAHEDFRAIVEEYYSEMQRLSLVVLNLIAATLPYGPHVFDELEADDPMWLFRLLHYPPITGAETGPRMQLGAGEHTDFGTITLLLQDEQPGLEVQDRRTGEWHGVPPQKDVYIVNMADVMSILTEGDYISSVHRVWNRSNKDRMSVVFFWDGKLDFKLRPLGNQAGDDGDDSPTIEEHVRARLTGSYSSTDS